MFKFCSVSTDRTPAIDVISTFWVCACMCVGLYIYIYIYECITYACICVFVCVFVYMCVGTYACTNICLY